MSSARQFPLQSSRVEALEQAELERVVDLEEGTDRRASQRFLDQFYPTHTPILVPTTFSRTIKAFHLGARSFTAPGIDPVIRGDPHTRRRWGRPERLFPDGGRPERPFIPG
jgi:hypothetical protein